MRVKRYRIDEMVYKPACAKPVYAKRFVQVVRFGKARLYELREEERRVVEGNSS
jgi:hypothetical protein